MQELLDLTVGLPEQVVEPGQSLVVEGEAARDVFVLLEGRLALRQGGVDVLELTEPGACIGERGVFLHRAHTSSVVAVERTRVRVIADAASTLQDNPAILFAAATLLARRIEMVEHYLSDIQDQYGDHEGGLGLVGQVLTNLNSHHGDHITPGSDREPDPLY